MLGLIILFWIIGAGLAYGAAVYKEKKINPGFDTFFVVIVWHGLWGVGWSFLFFGTALLLFWIPFFLFHWVAWLLFIAAVVLFFLGAFPLLFGKIFATFVGFFTDEIGEIPFVNAYFRRFHYIYWGKQNEYSPSVETIEERKRKDYSKTANKALVINVKYTTKGDLKFLCRGSTFDIVAIDEDNVILDTQQLLGYQLSFKKDELSIKG